MRDVEFDDVTRRFDDGTVALDHLSITIRASEMFGLVGPSGCGKTTALRILAGLDQPSSGRVLIGNVDVTNLPTRDRSLGLVTQANQLLSHRTARGNITFPLEVRNTRAYAGRHRERVVAEAAGLGIQHLLERTPDTLSEGERRSVQLARAVVNAPAILLLDEPLAFLEDQLRLRLRADVLRLHAERGLTSLLVTASQHDAMGMCDRIAVLFDGIIHQIGTPDDLYHHPATSRVGGFFGEPPMNLLSAPVRVEGLERSVGLLGREVRLATSLVDPYAGRSIVVGFRAEDVEIDPHTDDAVRARVEATEPLGHRTLAVVTTEDGTRLHCSLPGMPPRIGTGVRVRLPTDRLHLFDPATELALLHPGGR